jgi:hypothetical protein
LVALVVFVDAEAELPEEIAGNPELAVEAVAVAPVETDRTCVVAVGGVGTTAAEALAGSSKEGGGKIGFDDALPVPDGPPPPVRLRGVDPAAPLAALKACCTICC